MPRLTRLPDEWEPILPADRRDQWRYDMQSPTCDAIRAAHDQAEPPLYRSAAAAEARYAGLAARLAPTVASLAAELEVSATQFGRVIDRDLMRAAVQGLQMLRELERRIATEETEQTEATL